MLRIIIRLVISAALIVGAAPILAEKRSGPTESVTEVPDILFSAAPGSSRPIWVAAKAALNESGDLRQEFLGATAIEGFQRARSVYARTSLATQAPLDNEPRDITPDQCGGVMISNSRSHHTLGEELTNKNLWISADVEAVTPGFLFGQPGSLLTLRTTRDLHEATAVAKSRYVHVFSPCARFAIGQWLFCSGELTPPRIGSHVIVIARTFPVDDKGLVVLAGDGGVFTEDSTGTLLVPHTWRSDPLVARQKALSDLEALLARTLREHSNQKPSGEHNAPHSN